MATSPSPLSVSSVFPGCPLGFLLFSFCNYFSSFVFCYLGEFSFRSSFLGSLLPFSILSFTILLSSSVDGRGYLAAVLASVAGLYLSSFGLLPCVLAQYLHVRGLEFTLVVPFCLRPLGFQAFWDFWWLFQCSFLSGGFSSDCLSLFSFPPVAPRALPLCVRISSILLTASASLCWVSPACLLPLLLLQAALLSLVACLSCLVSALYPLSFASVHAGSLLFFCP